MDSDDLFATLVEVSAAIVGIVVLTALILGTFF
jgi:hypothetical protein